MATVPLSEPELAAQGWQRRFVVDPHRLGEHVELYESLGFETETGAVDVGELGPECATCTLATCPEYVVLYTRRAGARPALPLVTATDGRNDPHGPHRPAVGGARAAPGGDRPAACCSR